MRHYVKVVLDSCYLGIEDREYGVFSANFVRLAVCKPPINDNDWDASFQKSEWKEIEEAFQEWGQGMIEVVPFGGVVGEFLVRPL